MCPCIFYLFFCKETWLSVNRVIFLRKLYCFLKWKTNTFETCIWYEHLWIVFPIFKRSSNIRTIFTWLRIILFLGTFGNARVWFLPFLWMTKPRLTIWAQGFPASEWRGWPCSPSFLTSGFFSSPSVTLFQMIRICASMSFSTTTMQSESQRRAGFYYIKSVLQLFIN